MARWVVTFRHGDHAPEMVTASDIFTARRIAEGRYPGAVKQVRSLVDRELAEEEERIIQRNAVLRIDDTDPDEAA